MTIGICQGCKMKIRFSNDRWEPCGCGSPLARVLATKGEGQVIGVVPGLPPPQKKWSNAVKTSCAYSHRHASKMEARVCERLTQTLEKGDRLIQQVRLPILGLYNEDGRVPYMSVDFAVIALDAERGWYIKKLIDAKAKGRVSRDWPARKRALELSWGVKVEEVDR